VPGLFHFVLTIAEVFSCHRCSRSWRQDYGQVEPLVLSEPGHQLYLGCSFGQASAGHAEARFGPLVGQSFLEVVLPCFQGAVVPLIVALVALLDLLSSLASLGLVFVRLEPLVLVLFGFDLESVDSNPVLLNPWLEAHLLFLVPLAHQL